MRTSCACTGEGQTENEIEKIVESISYTKNELYESISLSESDTYRNEDPNKYKYLPKIRDLKKKDIWKYLQFRYFDKGYFKARPVIIIDASDVVDDRGLVLAMKITSKKKLKDENDKEILDKDGNFVYKRGRNADVDLLDWRKEGLDKPSYARTNEIQQLPIERFLPTKFHKDFKPKKLGTVSQNDWNSILKLVPNINTLKIQSKSDTTTRNKVVNLAKKLKTALPKREDTQDKSVDQKLVACYNLLKIITPQK